MGGIRKPLVDKQFGIAASTIEYLKLLSLTEGIGGVALTRAVVQVEVCCHLGECVVAHVPEGDESQSGFLAIP